MSWGLRQDAQQDKHAFGAQYVFDPYYKWLGIRPEHQPPDHYRLLGLERFESDRDVIQSAGERQTAHVQSYKIGPQSELSQKILNEIARAKVCLLNPSSKAEYDEGLRAKLASQVAPPPAVIKPVQSIAGGPARLPAVNEVQVPAQDLDPLIVAGKSSTSTSRLYRKATRKPPTLPLLLTAACLLLVVAIVASTLLFNSSGNNRQAQSVSSSRPAAPQSDISTRDEKVASRVTANRVASSLEHNAAPGSQVPTRAPVGTGTADTRRQIPTHEQLLEARSKLTIHGTPTAKQTLEAGRDATHPWTRYALLQMTIELAFQTDRAGWPEARESALEAARILAAEFEHPADFYDSIASQFLQPPPQASISNRNLRNWPPAVTASTPAVATDPLPMKSEISNAVESNPEVLTIEAPLIDLTKNQTEVRFKPIVAFEARKLLLTGLEVTNNRLIRQYPDSGQVELGTPIHVVLRDEPPRAGLEVSLHGTEELYVRIKPMIQDPDDVFYPWTESGLRLVRGKANRSLNQVNRGMDRASRLVADLATQQKLIENSPASAKNRSAIAEKLKAAEQEVAQVGEQLQRLEQFLADLDKLGTLTDKIDRKARLNFRVVQNNNGEEVRVVKTNP
jgi:hypothetical protein